MKKILFLLYIMIAGISAQAFSVSDVPKPGRTDPTPWVVNPHGVLSASAENEINATLAALNDSTTVEVAVVAIRSTEGEDIDLFANELFDTWGIGKANDNGVLLLIARDDRRYVLRTGRGIEGIIPDVTAGRIGRRILAPAFREGDFDGGVKRAVGQIAELVTDPAAADELRYEGQTDDESLADILYWYLVVCIGITAVLGIYAVARSLSKPDRYHKYLATRKFASSLPYFAIFLLGVPLLVYLPLRWKMRQWRDGRHACPNCGADMVKQDEEHDNDFLTPAQDLEERIGSVDYDVWTCPNCNDRVIYAFENPHSTLHECPNCHARACKLIDDKIVRRPTSRTPGLGIRTYTCLHCRNTEHRRYTIPKTESPTVVILPGSGSSSSGGFGGGFGGFGGGSTGGGGASGGW